MFLVAALNYTKKEPIKTFIVAACN